MYPFTNSPAIGTISFSLITTFIKISFYHSKPHGRGIDARSTDLILTELALMYQLHVAADLDLLCYVLPVQCTRTLNMLVLSLDKTTRTHT